MTDLTSPEDRAATSPRLPSRVRRVQEVEPNEQRALGRLLGALEETLIVWYTANDENSGPHLIDPAAQTFDALRRRSGVEQTERLLEHLMGVAMPADIVARLVDANESTVLKARLVTIVPRLRGKYRESDLIAVLGLLSTANDSEIRYVVADALAEFGDIQAVRLLQVLEHDPIPAIRTIAKEHLEYLK